MTAHGDEGAHSRAGGYEVVEHTADAGLVVWGRTLAELFEQAATGMYALMVERLETVRPAEAREVEVRATTTDGLLVAWLLELLFVTESEELLFSRFAVTLDGEQRALRGRAWGEPLDVDRHHIEVVVKAVTRHRLAITQEDGGYRAEVIFDV